jgi:hypothetical protein
MYSSYLYQPEGPLLHEVRIRHTPKLVIPRDVKDQSHVGPDEGSFRGLPTL